MRRILRSPRVCLSGMVILGVVLVAILAPHLAPYDPTLPDVAHRLETSSRLHPLGTDNFGRDVLSQLIFGARLSLGVAALAVAIAGTIGTILGVTASYVRGVSETAIMGVVDLLLGFPPILLGILAVAFLGPGVVNLGGALGVLFIPQFARVAHAATLTVRESDFALAARALGGSDLRIVVRHILPNILAPLMVQGSLTIGFAIVLESGLSYLGLGPPPPAPSWGRMVSTARGFMHTNPMLVVWPSVVTGVVILAFNVLGDGLRDTLDPRLKR